MSESAAFASAPNVTLPTWTALGATVLPLFAARSVCWLPLVPPGAARDAWEAYAAATLGLPSASIYVNANGTRARSPDAPLLVPLWQIAPGGASNEAARLLNLASVPVELAAMREAATTLAPALCDTLVLVQDRGLAGPPRPSSIMFAPVLSQGSVVAGFTSVVFSWDDALVNALPQFVASIDAVLRSSSGATYSFRIEGDEVFNTGAGVVYERGALATELGQAAHAISIGSTQNFTLELYPTAAMAASHLTRTPGVACAVVVCIVFATSLLFWAYDAWASGRSARLRGAFLLTRSVVEEAYPAGVRGRVLARHMMAMASRADNDSLASVTVDGAAAEPSARTSQTSSGSRSTASVLGSLRSRLFPARPQARMTSIAGFSLRGGAAAAQEPIADAFPAASILFADLVSFTAWAGSVPPARVFTVLEAVFAEFDHLAAQHGVFKGA